MATADSAPGAGDPDSFRHGGRESIAEFVIRWRREKPCGALQASFSQRRPAARDTYSYLLALVQENLVTGWAKGSGTGRAALWFESADSGAIRFP